MPILFPRLLLVAALFAVAMPAVAERILVLGDSLSAPHNMTPAQTWVSLLDARLQAGEPGRHQVINASISGLSSSGGLALLPGLLRKHRPEVVVIELGGNDALQGQPMTLIGDNFTRMVTLSRAAGARVALLGVVVPAPFSRVDAAALAGMYAGVARNGPASLMPSTLEGISGVPALLQRDGLHPNARAQPRLLDNAWPAIREALSAPAIRPAPPARIRWEQPRPH